MRTAISRAVWFVAGVVLALVVLELALRLMPVSKGLHRSTQFERWPLQYMEPGFRYDYSIGWAMLNAHHGVANNYGHVAPFDFKPRSGPVIVMGDSYIESAMNDYDETLQGQLGRKLGTPETVYGLGVSGASSSGYVALAAMARADFAPTAAVVLITDGDLSESLAPAMGTHYLRESDSGLQLRFEPIRAVPLSTKIRKAIGDISLHRYLQVNLQFMLSDIWKVLDTHKPVSSDVPVGVPADKQRRVADWLLQQLAPSLGVPPECVVLLLDSDRYALYRAQLASKPKDAPEARQFLIDEAQRRGYRVADLGPVFERRYALTKEKFDHWPIDRHWNAVGHGIAAQQAYQQLTSGEGNSRACLGRRPGP